MLNNIYEYYSASGLILRKSAVIRSSSVGVKPSGGSSLPLPALINTKFITNTLYLAIKLIIYNADTISIKFSLK